MTKKRKEREYGSKPTRRNHSPNQVLFTRRFHKWRQHKNEEDLGWIKQEIMRKIRIVRTMKIRKPFRVRIRVYGGHKAELFRTTSFTPEGAIEEVRNKIKHDNFSILRIY